jgi:predicted metal-binding protein
MKRAHPETDALAGARRVRVNSLGATTQDQRTPSTVRTTIHVCITCRRPTDPEDFPRPGAALAHAAIIAAAGTDITVRPVRCLANCRRGLSAAIGCEGSWTYVFGDLEASRDASALVDGARLLAAASDGVMPWRGRPDPLKQGLIARIPPFDHEDRE